MLLSTFFWGAGFLFVKWLGPILNPYELNHVRFFAAALLLLPYLIYQQMKMQTLAHLKYSFVASVLIYIMLTFQTYGLYFTSISKAGFLTTLYVVIIPIFLWFFERRTFSKLFVFCCLLSMVGVLLLNNADFSHWNVGDTLVLFCAIAGALHIIYIEKIQHKIVSSFQFNAEQCFFLAVLGLLFSFMHDENLVLRVMNFDGYSWFGLFGLSVLSSIVAYYLQIKAQKNLSAPVAGLLFLLESPFAAILGFFFLGEVLSSIALIGMGVILLASGLIIWEQK